MKNKKLKAVIAAMMIGAMTTVTAFAGTMSLSQPYLTYTSFEDGRYIKINGQMTSSTAAQLAITQYATYSVRGSSYLATGAKTTTESDGATTFLTANCTYTNMNGDHLGFYMAYNEGYYKEAGIQDYILYGVTSTRIH